MKTVAVIGASNNRGKFGNKAVRAYLAQGYQVIPVHLSEPVVEGIPAFKSVLEIPGPIDMATVYVPPEVTLGLLDELQQKQVPEIWINPGAEDDAVIAEARRRGLNVFFACSIVAIGRSPYHF